MLEEIYCNQCGFVGDDEDFAEHIQTDGHTGFRAGEKEKKVYRYVEDCNLTEKRIKEIKNGDY